MKKNFLGNTRMEVTEYCLGTLPMGPSQANLPSETCVEIIREAVKLGVNFIDTAETYNTQRYVGEAIKSFKREDVVIATKSPQAGYDEMARSVEKSLKDMDTNYIDIYHLHAVKASSDVLENRAGALKYLTHMKSKGVIKAIGISTHNVLTVNKAIENDNIDVIFPLINQIGLGILNGTKEDMIDAIGRASKKGIGIYAMKVLAGGNLLRDIRSNILWAKDIKGIASLSIGVVSTEELKFNLNIFGVKGLEGYGRLDTFKVKHLFIFKKICIGCGECVNACPNEALSLFEKKSKVDENKCILCGYCSPKCPQFAIRIL
jgi:aryl-alcohol dehydrogenase-like predicted oxidoreductase/Pyruvate/2-oxoacid:ferredoxin oxidoreductase delta subunit